jgi:DNA-binding PadR family transcriptional regulator
MRDASCDPEALLPLTPAVFHILLALVGGEKHGYGIMQEVAALTDGKMRIGPGTLYGSIKRLLAEGLIGESDERPDPKMDDGRRRYYRLTDLGQRVVTAEAKRLLHLVRQAQLRELLSARELAGSR